MKRTFSKIRGERIIIAALMMILTAEFFKTIWPLDALDFETTNAGHKFIAQSNSIQNTLISLLGLSGIYLLVISLISTGIRLLRNKWLNLKGIAMTMIGLLICLYNLLSIQAHMKIGKGLDNISRPNYEIIKFRLEQEKLNLPLKARSKFTKMYASDKYIHEGKIVSYLSESGEIKSYEPTNKEIKTRNSINNAREIWDYNNKTLPILLNMWIAVSIVSLVLGAFTPIRRATPNKEDAPDQEAIR